MIGTVEKIGRLTPSMIRITFGGAGLDSFVPAEATDQYADVLFPNRRPTPYRSMSMPPALSK